MEVASIRTGEKFDEKTALEVFEGRVKVLDKNKWFVPDFITFQYGELNEKNRLHLSVINILSKYSISVNKGVISPLEGAKDKDKEKDKVKDKERKGGTGEKQEIVLPFPTDKFRFAWKIWKDYRKGEFNTSYKTAMSEQAALKGLCELSGGKEEKAVKIIEQSMANHWKGFFELKNNTNGHTVNGENLRERVNQEFTKQYSEGRQ